MTLIDDATKRVPQPSQFVEVDASGNERALIEFLDAQAERFRSQRQDRLASLGLAPGDSVLDLGCGPGTDTFEMERIVGPAGRVVGIDLSEAMVAEANRRAEAQTSGATFLTGDARAIPADDGEFDVVASALLLIHVPGAEAAVREMLRVVRPGGRVVCSEPDHQMAMLDASDPELAERLVRYQMSRLSNPRMGRQLKGLFVDAGLVDVEVAMTPIPFTDWARAQVLLRVDELLEAAPAAGIASREAVRAVLADLEARARSGRFFGASMMVRCQGTKPT